MSGKRYAQVDIAKGICMLIVVFAHSFPNANLLTEGSAAYYLYKAIHSFMLPLFFFLSGLVFKGALRAVTVEEKLYAVKKRAVRMLVPYFTWALIFVPLRLLFSEYARFDYDFSKIYTLFLGNNPCGQLWFLYIMFLFSVTAIAFATESNIKYLLPVAFIVTLMSPLAHLKYNGISWSNSFFQFFFFYLGLFFSRYIEKLFKFMNVGGLIASIAVFAVSFKFFLQDEFYLLRIIVSVSAIYAVLYISNAISIYLNTTQVSSALQEIGRYSMDIYILHSPMGIVLRLLLINIAGVSRWVYTLIYFLVGIIGSYVVSRFILRKAKILKLLLLGMNDTSIKASADLPK